MAIKVIAQRRVLKIGKNPGVKKFVMRPELYTPIQEKKVFKEASVRSGISVGAMKAAWDAAGEVIKAWATEGHSVPLPGLGTMRFSVRSKAVEDLEDVKTSLISTRRIVFTPSVDVKEELAETSIQITCLDEDGTILKRVTSDDGGEVEDDSLTPDPSPEGEGSENGGNAGGENQGGSTGGNTGGGGGQN
ncbi:MAG: DNA-binding protein [Bacteroidaceae bacterium]|nr:DNA-binding protein [Bacteroidaceae bacterium]